MAQSANVDFNSVQGNLKTVFAGYENAVPQESILMREFGFESGSKVGDEYQYGVELTRPHGHTTAAPGFFPVLNQPVARQSPKAKLQPYQHYLRERVTYDVLSRCQDSSQAAKSELGATIESMRESMMFRQEVFALYGQSGLAVIGTITGDTVILTLGSYASGMWAGNENMPLSIRNSTGATYVKDVTILSVNDSTRTLTLNPGDTTGLSVGQTLWFQGGSPTTEPVGISYIIQNTGTLYNISAASYGLWQGNNLALSGSEDLGFKRAIQLDAQIRSRGGMGDQLGLVNPDVYTTLVGSVEAARDFGGDQYKTAEIDRGTRQLRYFSPTGCTTIMAHPLVKHSDYFSLRRKKWFRAGATDPTGNIPGEGGKVLFDLQDYPGKELRMMANNTWFTPRPAASGMVTNINWGGTVLA